jgi:hypothetical protein
MAGGVTGIGRNFGLVGFVALLTVGCGGGVEHRVRECGLTTIGRTCHAHLAVEEWMGGSLAPRSSYVFRLRNRDRVVRARLASGDNRNE